MRKLEFVYFCYYPATVDRVDKDTGIEGFS